ncbi:hypothetical protein Tco_0718946 [Tanacetum coccineum]
MLEIIYSIYDEVREIECYGGSNAKEHISFTSRQEIFVNINSTYDVLMNENMCRFEIRAYLFNEEIAWILKCELEFKEETVSGFLATPSGFANDDIRTLATASEHIPKIDINYASGRNLRRLSAEEAWETIKDYAQCDKQWKNPTSTISDQTIANLKAQLVKNKVVRVMVPKCMSWLDAYDEPIGDMEDKVDNPSPQSTPQVLPSFEVYIPPVIYSKEVDETIGILMEVELLDHMKLEDLGLNTCTDMSKITRKQSKTGKHGHGNQKSDQEAKNSNPKPEKSKPSVNSVKEWSTKVTTKRQNPNKSPLVPQVSRNIQDWLRSLHSLCLLCLFGESKPKSHPWPLISTYCFFGSPSQSLVLLEIGEIAKLAIYLERGDSGEGDGCLTMGFCWVLQGKGGKMGM